MTKFVPGDIVEVETPRGLAYVQITHNHPSYPEVARALTGPYEPGADAAALARLDTRFVAMIPLAGAVDSGFISARLLGNAPVPDGLKAFPKFKMSILDKHEGKRENVAYWWFWDGDTLSYDIDPGPDIENIPLREVMSIEEFMRKIAPHQPLDSEGS